MSGIFRNFGDSEVMAAIKRESTARTAHHEAGHAVAAVMRGGRLISVSLGQIDWDSKDWSWDQQAETHHSSRLENQPFVTFAGPWAQAKWMLENDPDIDTFDEAIQCAWEENPDGDGEKYESFVGALETFGSQFGFYSIGRSWQLDWSDELETIWPAIQEIAALLIAGETVTHLHVVDAIDRVTGFDDITEGNEND